MGCNWSGCPEEDVALIETVSVAAAPVFFTVTCSSPVLQCQSQGCSDSPSLRTRSAGRPVGMVGEEAFGKSDLVANEESEAQAEQTRRRHESAIQPRKFATGERKRQGERDGDQHHSSDRAGAKNQQVKNRPFRIVNRAQH